MLNISDNSIKYILFQRTNYLVLENIKWLNSIIIRLPFINYNQIVSLEARIFKKRIKKLFSADMEREFYILKNFLPEKPENILDVGCGIAGVDIFIDKYYKSQGKLINIFLLDKTELDQKIYYGFNQIASFYNSFDIAKEMLKNNGVDLTHVQFEEAVNSKIFSSNKFDLIISLLSWGFHYPVSTYLEEAYQSLNQGGRLIIDIRKNTDGAELLKKRFGNCRMISKERYLLIK